MSRVLIVKPLDAHAFGPFGEVIAPEAAARSFPINEGRCTRFHDLATVDCASQEGRAGISLFRADPQGLPITLAMLERHPLGSQTFVPLSRTPYLVVVSESPDTMPQAFLVCGGQGVSYRRGTWHHPLLALDVVSDFLVVDRIGSGDNCETAELAQSWRIEALSR